MISNYNFNTVVFSNIHKGYHIVSIRFWCGYIVFIIPVEEILPPLAVRAGLGELGRHNILVADRFGSRVRIGAVTTSMELTHDTPADLGVDHFCTSCRKCAESCPSNALSLGEKETIRGVAKWPTNAERCYGYWRTVGTDCGICMAVCPFSHRDNWFHNLVRAMIHHFPWSHRPALWFDDLVYGRKWRPKEKRSG